MKLIEVIVATGLIMFLLLFNIGCFFTKDIYEYRKEEGANMSKYEFKTISTDQFELHYDKRTAILLNIRLYHSSVLLKWQKIAVIRRNGTI